MLEIDRKNTNRLVVDEAMGAIKQEEFAIEELTLNSGQRIEVVNIGRPELSVKLNREALSMLLDNPFFTDVGRDKVKIVFDNRSLTSAIENVLAAGLKPATAKSAIETIFTRILTGHASAEPNSRVVYINTQDLVFWQLIGLFSLEKTLRHEIKHMKHNEEYLASINQGEIDILIRQWLIHLLGIVSQVSFSYTVTNKLIVPEVIKGLNDSAANIERLLLGFGVFVIGAGAIQKVYERVHQGMSPWEQEAYQASKTDLHLKVFDSHPETFFIRAVKNISSRIANS